MQLWKPKDHNRNFLRSVLTALPRVSGLWNVMAGSRNCDCDVYMTFGKGPIFRRNISLTFSHIKSKSSKKPVRSIWLGVFLLVFVFDPEDGSGMFLRNFRLIPDYRVLQPRRMYYWRYYSLHYSVACRAVTVQRSRDKQIHQSRL
jgi:hypothetical protein